MENQEPVKKGAAVVIIKGNNVLLIKASDESGHATGIYGLPAGSLKDSESYIEAAVRELEEEAGLKTKVEDLVRLPTFYEAILERKDGQKKFCAWAYYCKRYTGEVKASIEGTPEWVEIQKAKTLHLQVKCRQND